MTGGTQPPTTKGEEHRYDRGVIVSFDPESGRLEECFRYVSPPELRAPEKLSVTFKAGVIHEGSLHVCTTTEVLSLSLDDWSVERHVTHPWLNDVHSVVPTQRGGFLVSVTGLDIVAEIGPGGELLRHWEVGPVSVWDRFARGTDFRRIASTKPHASHPNYVFCRGEEVWVNRLKQNDAICLTAERPAIRLEGQAHDGVRAFERIWFTTVDGRVHVVHGKTLEVLARHDLNEMTPGEAPLGWCRSILPVSPTRAWVGFSRIRPTKFAEHLSWLKRGFRNWYRPTRIGLYDLERGVLEREVELEDVGLHAVFSILSPELPYEDAAPRG